jgi:hypothetical protein
MQRRRIANAAEPVRITALANLQNGWSQMATRRRIPLPAIKDGVRLVPLASWRELYGFFDKTLISQHDYIFRGQREAGWPLESSLDRALRRARRRERPARAATHHLNEFELAIRGRRGTNPQRLDETEKWALGQHYGLWTPLLDWTESPFVALYFAFEEPTRNRRIKRAAFALSRPHVEAKSLSIAQPQLEGAARSDILEIITPLTDENTRLVSQGGLFTRVGFGDDIEKWVRRHFVGNSKDAVLVKLVIPEGEDDRDAILRALNRMNINHRSLFPDIVGSAEFCNKRLVVPEY